jgi:predicted translin family RNA/ssDNA-binding protein
MNEKQCREHIKNDLREIAAICLELIADIDETDLNDIDCRLDNIAGKYGKAKKRLLDCEDY